MKTHEQEWRVRHTNIGPIVDDVSGHPEGEAVCMVYAPMSYEARDLTLAQSDAIRNERAKAIESLPKMARALLALYARAAETGASIGQGRTAEQVAEMDITISHPASVVRDAIAALKSAGDL